ncbi:MAG TPA: CopD family protein [Candidatus Udaeobacter sp.]|nr:CopD family protein [Candidatus Udaeobacter sp.]
MLISLLIFVRAVHIAASILIAGTFTFDVVMLGFVRRPASEDLLEVERSLVRLAIWTAVAALVSAVLWFWLEVLNMAVLPFTDAFSVTPWKTVLLQTVFGHVWQFRLGAMIVVVLVLIVSTSAGTDAPRRSAILCLWFLSVFLVVSLAWISHAAAAPVQPVGLIGDALHLCAAGAWIGGLVPLVICLLKAPVLSAEDEILSLVIGRFSTLSLCCVSVLIVTGISNSWLLVGSIHALVTTGYGWLLLLKLTLFGILIALGARNRMAIKASASTSQTESSFLQKVRRNVIGEICLGATVVIIVACLGVTPPAAHP